MDNKKILGFLQSFVMIPALMSSFTWLPANNVEAPTKVLATIQQNNEIESVIGLQTATFESRAALVDAYFAKHNSALEGYGMKMVLAADKYQIDWRLVPTIAMLESTGGNHPCKNDPENFAGWNGCKGDRFDSIDHTIEVISMNLGGYSPATERAYNGKTIKQIINAYNPPSIAPNYLRHALLVMNEISPTE